MSLLSRLAISAARAYGILSSNPNAVSADYLVVAGGGGSAGYNGGGAGAGGLLTSTFTLSTLNTYSITVGAGGTAGNNAAGSRGTNGADSIISGTGLTTVTSTGGGTSGSASATLSVVNGSSGGSGGGAGGATATNATVASGTSGQGNAGGDNFNSGGYGSGGGGGASAVGGNGTTSASGNGGAGTASSISGSSVTYAGGGGGGSTVDGATRGTGGAGGGGDGGASGNAGAAGTVNTGGGGGGGAHNQNGAAGGSGIVIISYTSATPRFVGGTITTSGGKQIHTFTSSGTLSPITPITASYLVVAGGGGAVGNRSGGGGAGGLLTSSTTLYSGATYIVTIGAGGAGGAGNAGVSSTQDGSNSVLSGTGLTTITATGGGGGGGTNNPSSGRSGGSGGGAGGDNATGATGGSGTSGQGFAGGTSATGGGGGGGGASAVGSNGSSNTGGNGGAGTASSISGTSVTYAGGGGGGATTTAGTGGAGGGGNGAGGSPTTQSRGVDGTQNSGGGAGGGSNYTTTAVTQASGGSGIVIISYAGSQVFNGGLVTTSGGNTIHTFTSTGALTPLTNNLNNSLRFRSSASSYLSRTPTLATNRRTWTWSAWVKRGTLNTFQCLLGAGTSGSARTFLVLNAGSASTNDNILLFHYNGATGYGAYTTPVYRDLSAWYHIVVAVDTTQATAANRIKIYVNGNQQAATGFDGGYPAQNTELFVNNNTLHTISKGSDSSTDYIDGYLTDIYLIDGQALEPYYFGNNDANGVWKPIQYKGTYGTNGFYLTFGNTTSTTTLGYDSSPNGNNWTCNNISLTAGTTYDAMTDVPTNTSATVGNFCVVNPLKNRSPSLLATYSDGNLKIAFSSSSSNTLGYGTMAATSGKWYWEATILAVGSSVIIGIADPNSPDGFPSASRDYSNSGNKDTGGSGSSYGASYTTNDVIGVALDIDNGTIVFYKNGVSQGTAFTDILSALPAGGWTPFAGGTVSASVAMNFGQRPFSYTPPTGFVALNTFNLPTPTILQGNKYMDATLYTGNGSTQTITNSGAFKPDLVWVKSRSSVQGHGLYNPLMSGYVLDSSSSGAQAGVTPITNNANGWTMPDAVYNNNAVTYVGWQWQAGQGTNTTNTAGSITSTVSVNTTAGFSIVTYTGTAANATIGHGLGVAPKFIIIKNRSTSVDWRGYHVSIGATAAFGLNLTATPDTNSAYFNNTNPTSSVYSVGNSLANNGSGNSIVAYCWAEIAGFSRFTSYTGNGSSDGPFVYLGFRPKFIMIKSSAGVADDWSITDTSRSTYNLSAARLSPNRDIAEDTNVGVGRVNLDILSNGFKIRQSSDIANGNGFTYIVAAWAENPFKNANAR